MKIAIVSHPRSGSTKLCNLIAQIYVNDGCVNLSEVAQAATPLLEKYLRIKTLNETKNCVVKLHSYVFVDISPMTVEWSSFDCIFFLVRPSIIDAYISDKIAISRRNHVRGVDNGENNENFSLDVSALLVTRWVNEKIVPLAQVKSTIEQRHTAGKFIELTYDEVMDNKTLLKKLQQYDSSINELPHISSIPSGINYKEQCINYLEIENKFKELGLCS